MNSGIARFVVVTALIIGGVIVLLNGFTGSGGATAAPVGDSSIPPTTTTQDRVTPSPAAPRDTTIAVFNGAESPALGTTVLDDVLQPAGYRAPAVAANAPSKPVTETVVYYVGGADAAQNKANAARMRDTYFRHAKVQELDPVYAGLIDRGVQVVVVVGDDYTAP